jgi:hypothetical protein
MEIKLNAGDKITIPTGCKATIEDNLIGIEEKQEEFKDGDILKAKETNKMLVFKRFEGDKDSFCSYYSSTPGDNFKWGGRYFRHATEEERQAFFDELKLKGLRWNAETKTMERIRKRAELDEDYLYIDRGGKVIQEMEGATVFDDKNYNSGNYYLPEEREQAEEDAKAIRAIFEKRLKVE